MHGWLFVDKPEGVTSFAVVSLVRRFLAVKKVGHAGTLDPLASGLLALAVGEATKTIPFVMEGQKVYDFVIGWGHQTQTDDREGAVLYRSSWRPSIEEIRNCLAEFTGTLSQIPPRYSAIKIKGKRAYQMVRAGQEVDLQPREVQIFDFQHVERIDADRDRFQVTCSKGTYIRSLARDLGLKLGCYGYALAIRRLQSGIFSITDTISLENLCHLGHNKELQKHLSSIPDVLDGIPAVRIGSIQEQRLRCGQSIDGTLLAEHKAHTVVLCLADQDRPIGLCYYEDQTLKPMRLFNI